MHPFCGKLEKKVFFLIIYGRLRRAAMAVEINENRFQHFPKLVSSVHIHTRSFFILVSEKSWFKLFSCYFVLVKSNGIAWQQRQKICVLQTAFQKIWLPLLVVCLLAWMLSQQIHKITIIFIWLLFVCKFVDFVNIYTYIWGIKSKYFFCRPQKHESKRFRNWFR